jgi:anti-anti-sigma regulatory factor
MYPVTELLALPATQELKTPTASVHPALLQSFLNASSFQRWIKTRRGFLWCHTPDSESVEEKLFAPSLAQTLMKTFSWDILFYSIPQSEIIKPKRQASFRLRTETEINEMENEVTDLDPLLVMLRVLTSQLYIMVSSRGCQQEERELQALETTFISLTGTMNTQRDDLNQLLESFKLLLRLEKKQNRHAVVVLNRLEYLDRNILAELVYISHQLDNTITGSSFLVCGKPEMHLTQKMAALAEVLQVSKDTEYFGKIFGIPSRFHAL